MFYQEKEFIDSFINLIKECNNIVLSIYNTDFDVDYKEDESPLTIADKSCNYQICFYLDLLYRSLLKENKIKENDMIVISEENKNEEYEKRKECRWTWLVDPVDGTKEFVKKNGQFTVNIGLAEYGVPVFGIVSIPVTGEIYYGVKGIGSYKIEKSRLLKLNINKCKNFEEKGVRIIASSSHLNEETKNFISTYEDPIIINVGSSIKLLWIAENKADLYPRIAPTSEWDTCAAHAVVKFAGGEVFDFNTLNDLVYNKENLLNPYFIVM